MVKIRKIDLLEYIKEKYEVMPEYLWDNDPNSAVFRNKNKKWFAIIMNISKNKLGLDSNEFVDIVNVKCFPEMIGGFRKENGFFSAYHMSKEHWITILLDGTVNKEKIESLIDISYDLTSKK